MDKPGKISALRTQDINPHIVMQTLQENIADINEMFVVTFTNEGSIVYATGDMSMLAHAALVLHDLALKHLNGEVAEDEDDGPPAI